MYCSNLKGRKILSDMFNGNLIMNLVLPLKMPSGKSKFGKAELQCLKSGTSLC
jgi:hypothetical protein